MVVEGRARRGEGVMHPSSVFLGPGLGRDDRPGNGSGIGGSGDDGEWGPPVQYSVARGGGARPAPGVSLSRVAHRGPQLGVGECKRVRATSASQTRSGGGGERHIHHWRATLPLALCIITNRQPSTHQGAADEPVNNHVHCAKRQCAGLGTHVEVCPTTRLLRWQTCTVRRGKAARDLIEPVRPAYLHGGTVFLAWPHRRGGLHVLPRISLPYIINATTRHRRSTM